MAIDLILGTAGHIDHGKTALIRALTGVETDRLPEEKRRGITIELGFAALDLEEYRLGIVDVPGHERFVRNMLAGATGIDLALLVVAADESIKPQTREHLDILRFLDLQAGVIALTKCDLAEAEWIDLVEDEVRELVTGTFLAEAPIVRTSATTGAGLEELRDELRAAAGRAVSSDEHRDAQGPFRLAIDRVFTVAGHGTVVTGSAASGVAAVGDTLEIQPLGRRVRVRELQNHDRPVERVHRGQRAALNLAGVQYDEIGHGQELAAAGHLVPSKLLSVELEVLPAARRRLKHRERVRVHLGTAEILATVATLAGDAIEPGERGLVQLFLREPAVSIWRQPLVVRRESPLETIGGGHVLDPDAPRIKRDAAASISRLEDLASRDALRRASASAYFRGLRAWEVDDLARIAAIDDAAGVVEQLIARGDLVRLPLSASRSQLVHAHVLEQWFDRLENALARLHELEPLAPAIERSKLAARVQFAGEPVLIEALLNRFLAAGRAQATQGGLTLAGRAPQLSSGQQQLLERLLSEVRAAEFQPPALPELAAHADKNRADVPSLLELAASQGQLVRIAPEMFMDAGAEQQLRSVLAERFRSEGGLKVAQIRDALGISRKHAVPLCEYLDRIGFTRRDGDLRFLADEAAQAAG